MKTHLIYTLITGIALTFALPVLAADIPDSKDNPFIKRFDGSDIVRYKALNYDSLNFVEKDGTKAATVEGKVLRMAYRVPASAASSSLEVYRNYETELKAKGFNFLRDAPADDILFSGAQGATGSIMNLGNQHGYSDAPWLQAFINPYYIYGTKPDPAGTIHLSVAVFEMTNDTNGVWKKGDIGIYVDSVQEKPLANKMVDGTANDMAKQIASTGSVNLYGIYFDTDKTDLKPESKATLDEVSKLLSSDTTLKLKVVGHTDNVGSADHNNDLSMRRAQSVVHELVATYSVSQDRLTSFGAGFTQPVASNDTDDGRAKNRRVELVKL